MKDPSCGSYRKYLLEQRAEEIRLSMKHIAHATLHLYATEIEGGNEGLAKDWLHVATKWEDFLSWLTE